MTDYSKMCDFEINCSVLEFFEPEVEHMCLSADKKSLYHCGLDGNGFHEIVIPDYCNSWADAGPIIVASNISLHAPSLRDGWMAEFTGNDKDVNDGYEADYFESRHQNPLRAAMIVFLMMKERADENA